uniref:Uncharacterized protein n=1 Tax=Prasinoderma coloniale TaxID=156133 RepID=A0A7R9TX22_9VIRI|eukprot:PRCOL_00004253-RA
MAAAGTPSPSPESVLAALKTGGAFDRLKKKLVAAVIERRDEPGGLDDTTKAAVTDAIREAGDHDLPLDMGAAALAAKISADIEESVLTRVAVEAWDALAGEELSKLVSDEVAKQHDALGKAPAADGTGEAAAGDGPRAAKQQRRQ